MADANKLLKEIITTTTERFNEDGKIKEKQTETREKIYEYNNYTEEQIKNAKIVNSNSKEEPEEEKPKEDKSKSESSVSNQPAPERKYK